LLLWGLGVTLCVHIVSWLGVSYFDQSWVIWLLHLASASAAAQAVRVPRRRVAPGEDAIDNEGLLATAGASS
jgi:hypothetical protein